LKANITWSVHENVESGEVKHQAIVDMVDKDIPAILIIFKNIKIKCNYKCDLPAESDDIIAD
jgi:hypothetical protein